MTDETASRTGTLQDLDPDERELVRAADAARARAHAPYSRYRVGAAVRTEDGAIHPGCNIENCSFSLTVCAERVALFGSRAHGGSAVRALAIVGPGHAGRPTPPCGACRQVMHDLAPNARILLATPDGKVEVWRVDELLPRAFSPDQVNER